MKFGKKHILILLNVFQDYTTYKGVMKTESIRAMMYTKERIEELNLRQKYVQILKLVSDEVFAQKFFKKETSKFPDYSKWERTSGRKIKFMRVKRKPFREIVIIGSIALTMNGMRYNLRK